MGNFSRDDRGGNRGGYQSRGRSSYGGGRGRYQGRGRSSYGDDRGSDRQMFKAICDNCGKECEVPFRPTSGKPVYCSDCFEKMGGRNSDSQRPERSEFRPSFQSSDQSKAQLDAVNAKLDKILRLLESKEVASEAATEVKEAKASKVKKTEKA